ncbi:MAG: 50S ribosomal protein L9 [bacterium]
MKIILIKDVKKVGRKYEVKDVADGFALNYLIPNGLALQATAGVLKTIDLEKARSSEEKKVHEDLLVLNLKSIDGKTVVMEESANEKGHLFAAIHAPEILKPLQEQTRVQINPENIVLEKPIKEIGSFVIPVKAGAHSATFTLEVKAKEGKK